MRPEPPESALLNLAINARDAMPDGGRLIITMLNTGRRTIRETDASSRRMFRET